MGEALIEAAARGRDPDHAARRVLPRERLRDARPRACSSASPTATRRRGRSARRRCAARRTRGSAPRSTPSARCRRTSSRRSRAGRASAARRCTPTCPSSARRTRPAWPPTAARRRSCSTSTARSAPRCCMVHATHLTDADVAPPRRHRRDLHVRDHRARPRRRHRPRPRARRRRRAAVHGQRQPRRDRPVRGGARGRARRAAAHASAAATSPPPSCCAPRPPTHAAIGWPEAGRIEPGAPADLVTVVARLGAARGRRSRTRCSSPRCSPRPPPTSAT